MKTIKKNTLIILLLLLSGIVQSQSFVVTYPSAKKAWIHDIAETKTHGYIACGYTGNPTDSTTDAYLIGINNIGDTLWTKRHNWGAIDGLSAILPISDTTYLAVGGVTVNGVQQGLLLKLNNNGDTIFSRTYTWGNGSKNGEFEQIVYNETHDLVIIGYQELQPYKSSTDYWLLKIDENGNVITDKALDIASYDLEPYLNLINDHLFLNGAKDQVGLFIAPLSTSLDTIWSRTYDAIKSPNGDELSTMWYSRRLAQLKKPNFYAGTKVEAVQCFQCPSNYKFGITKFNEIGDTAWVKSYGGYNNRRDEIYNIIATTDNNLYLTGNYNCFESTGPSQLNVMKADSLGNLIWSKLYGNGKYQFTTNAILTSDEGLILVGKTGETLSGIFGEKSDIYILKLDKDGNLVTGIKDISVTENKVLIYPNPADNFINIKIANYTGNLNISVSNIVGEKVLSHNYSANNHEINMESSVLANGIYILTATTGNWNHTYKVIVQH